MSPMLTTNVPGETNTSSQSPARNWPGSGACVGAYGKEALSDARMALSLADRAYVLSSGKIVFAGTAEELKNNPVLERAYLGGA